MASISNDGDGTRRILFIDRFKKRRAIRLGKVPKKSANEIKLRVEALNVAKISNTSPDADTARWAASIGDDLAEKLRAVGLIEGRASGTLDDFIGGFIKSRTDLKPNTVKTMEQTRQYLNDFFKPDSPLRSITPGDCDRFLIFMKGKYAEATAARNLKRARQFFQAAKRSKLIAENPFEGIKPGSEKNSERLFFVSREVAEKLIEASPCSEWRAIIALSRYGGLRCPSEHLALTWDDIDWAKRRMLVRASKTEHHESRGKRWVPIFPELRPHLEKLFDDAEPGQKDVINRYRDPRQNLRTTFLKVIHRAGLLPWPRLFQNLRATRETELAATYPLHVVVSWIGNSQVIAAKHYLSVTDADFERAAEGGEKAAHNPAQTASEQARHGASSSAGENPDVVH